MQRLKVVPSNLKRGNLEVLLNNKTEPSFSSVFCVFFNLLRKSV